MTETVRLRVEFTDLHILSKSQRTDGLRRSWILLKPQHRTISDLAAYLLHVFDLHDSCPEGLLISMDEFVLPPFESTCIFKDKDIVSVRRKGVSEIAMIENGGNCIEVGEIVERRLVNGGMKLLAGEEFEKEKGGYESELEEDEPSPLEDTLPVKSAPDNGTSTHSKKRKRSEKPESSRKKRSKSATIGECSVVPEGIHGNVQEEKKKSARKRRAKKILSKKEKITTIEGELDDSSTSDTNERANNRSHSTRSANRNSQLQENGTNGVVSSQKPDESNKMPSRSARRKKARRKWLRENMKAQKEESHQTQVGNRVNQQSSDQDNQKSSNNDNQQSSDKANQQLSVNDKQKSSEEDGSETDNDEEDNVVPVVTRPGHIRFAPLGKVNADQSSQQNEIPVETFQWNGITSKKKGQKWGMEKTSYSKKSNYEDVYQESSVMVGIEEEIPENDPLDFDKLDLPTTELKEGDQIAYQLIELSSCWTPEVSSYRVGKVSQYNPQTNKIVLVQVPEYPIVFEETTDEASEVQPDTSLYGEDGSLEIDYSSLIDVRIVKYGKLNTAKAVAGDQNAASGFRLKNDKETQAAASGFRLKNDKGSQAAASGFRLKNDKRSQAAASGFGNDKEKSASTQENGKVNTWDEISQALNAKKAELSQENGSWTTRPWRGSALGPTMALLRAQSEL